jgi:predicted nucleic acid-binding protein
VILVDTSIWIAHLRQQLPDLATLLGEQRVLTHPSVIGELACGQIRQRAPILRMLSELPCAASASHDEVLQMIEYHRLWGKGIGLIDFHLLASTALTGCRFWTSDRKLAEMAAALGLDWRHKPQ